MNPSRKFCERFRNAIHSGNVGRSGSNTVWLQDDFGIAHFTGNLERLKPCFLSSDIWPISFYRTDREGSLPLTYYKDAPEVHIRRLNELHRWAVALNTYCELGFTSLNQFLNGTIDPNLLRDYNIRIILKPKDETLYVKTICNQLSYALQKEFIAALLQYYFWKRAPPGGKEKRGFDIKEIEKMTDYVLSRQDLIELSRSPLFDLQKIEETGSMYVDAYLQHQIYVNKIRKEDETFSEAEQRFESILRGESITKREKEEKDELEEFFEVTPPRVARRLRFEDETDYMIGILPLTLNNKKCKSACKKSALNNCWCETSDKSWDYCLADQCK
jgi:hypothetical protein